MAQMEKMTDDDFNGGSRDYFDPGVHEVVIESASRGTSQSGTEYVGVIVQGTEGQRDELRLYLSEKAAPYTRKTLAGIAVHNRDTEEEKQKVKDAFKAITNTDDLDDKFLKRFVDMQAWILREEDLSAPKPNGGFYLRSNLFSYEPKPSKVSQVVKDTEQVDPSQIPF